MKALLLAETCNPDWVSVPLVGWSHAKALSKQIDCHLVSQVRNREAFLKQGLVEGRDFTLIDSEKVDQIVWKVGGALRGGSGKGFTTMSAAITFGYYYFERLLWQQLGDRIKAHEWDLVHRITPLSPTIPSTIARRCAKAGVPFILGPLNGGVPWPRAFDSARRAEREWLSYVRSGYKILPGASAMRDHASAIIIGSKDTLKLEPRRNDDKSFYIPENAIDPAKFSARRQRSSVKPIRILFAGRLVPYKGCDMLLEAAAPLIRIGAVTLEIIGDGPQKNELQAIIQREGIAAGATLPGWVEHSQLQHKFAGADLFGFPSIREFGGGVVLEAMAVGLVPLVVNYGGPGELVTPETGFLVEMAPRAELVASIRSLLQSLVADPSQIDTRSPAAIARIHKQFTWDAKAADVIDLYKWVLDKRAPKPHFAVIPDPTRTPELQPLTV